MRAVFVRCLTLAGTLAVAAPVAAQEPAPSGLSTPSSAADSALEARTTEVASRLRCPVCQGESIQDSPAELAQQMRQIVKDQLREGRTAEEIEAYFVGRYGEWILLEPTMTGLNKALYAFPVVLVIGGLVLIVVLVRRWTAGPADLPASETEPDAESLPRIT